MSRKVGDKCPKCGEGLLVRTETGIACDECSFEMDIDEVVEQVELGKRQAGKYTFKPKTIKTTVDDPEEAEEFLRGLILARQNNNSEFFVDLIDAVNAILEPWRAAKQLKELAARDAGS